MAAIAANRLNQKGFENFCGSGLDPLLGFLGGYAPQRCGLFRQSFGSADKFC